jgi:hypothetical protein
MLCLAYKEERFSGSKKHLGTNIIIEGLAFTVFRLQI